MAIQNAQDLFYVTLSNLHASEQRLAKAADELSQHVQDPDIKNILGVRAYLAQQDVSNLEKCFQLLGKQPVPSTTRFTQVWAEDALKEVQAIQGPILKALYALTKIRTIQNFHIGEYAAVTAMAAFAGNRAVTTLLEHTLADKIDFAERTDDFVADFAEQALAGRAPGKAA